MNELIAKPELKLTKPKPQGLKRAKARHHRLAQLLAAGATPKQAAAATGFKVSRVYWLQSQDSLFKELVELYRQDVAAAFRDFAKEMEATAFDALREVQRRLEETPEEFSPRDLTDLVKTLADRTGYGPTEKKEVSFTRGIAQAMEEVVDAEVVEDSPRVEET